MLKVNAQEVMGTVAHDRPPDRAAVLPRGERLDWVSGHVRADKGVVGQIAEHRAVDGVRARFRDGIREPTGETAVPDVEGSHQHLNLLKRLERNRPRQRLSPWKPTGVRIAIHAAVNLEAVEQSILAADRDAAGGAPPRRGRDGYVRAEEHQGEKVAAEVRQDGDSRRGDDLDGSRTARVEDWVSGRVDHDRRQLDGRGPEREIRDQALAQGQQHTAPRLGREPQSLRLDAIGPAHRNILEQVMAGGARGHFPAAPVRCVGNAHRGPDDRRPVLGGHRSLNRRARDALSRQEPSQERDDQERKPVLHCSALTSLWKRRSSRRGSHVGSIRSHAAVRCPGIESRCSSWATAASRSPTIA